MKTKLLINYETPSPQNNLGFALLFSDAKRSAKKMNKYYWKWMWKHSVLLNEFNVNNRYINFCVETKK